MNKLICYEDPFSGGQVLCVGIRWDAIAATTAIVNCLSCITYHNNINSYRARFNIVMWHGAIRLKGARAVIQRGRND